MKDLRSDVLPTSAPVDTIGGRRNLDYMDTNTKRAIVVGIDGSANSEAALEWAVAEASRRKLRLTLFCAGIRSISGSEAVYYDAEMSAASAREALAHAHEHLAAAVSRAGEISPELSITIEGVTDFPAGGLVELSGHADTVVVGRSGHGPLMGAALGSVALQVLTHARCPVVVVHETQGDMPVAKGVVVGIDGSDVSELAIGYAFEQAALRGVHLDVVHAWWIAALGGLTQDIKTDMATQQRLEVSETVVGWREKYPDVEVRTCLPIGPAVLSLTEAAKNAELLVVGSRGRGGFASLLLGSVSQGVLQHAACTVAVVRARSVDSVTT